MGDRQLIGRPCTWCDSLPLTLELGVGTGKGEGRECDVYSQVSALLTWLQGKAFFALAGQLGLRWDQGWGVLSSRTLSCLSL